MSSNVHSRMYTQPYTTQIQVSIKPGTFPYYIWAMSEKPHLESFGFPLSIFFDLEAMMLCCGYDVGIAKDGFQEMIPYGVEQYTNARGCHWQFVRARGSGSGLPRKGKLSPFTTTNSDPDLGCIFLWSPFWWASCYSLWLTTIVSHSRGPHLSFGTRLVATKDSSQRTTGGFVVVWSPFRHTTSLIGQNAVNVWKPIPTHSMRFLPLHGRGSMCTILNPLIFTNAKVYYTSLFLLQLYYKDTKPGDRMIAFWSRDANFLIHL